jgi:hypothetical protein
VVIPFPGKKNKKKSVSKNAVFQKSYGHFPKKFFLFFQSGTRHYARLFRIALAATGAHLDCPGDRWWAEVGLVYFTVCFFYFLILNYGSGT